MTGGSMSSTLRTFALMAALTALLMGLGWLIGGRGGALIALIFAGAGNIWAWWNSDKAMLRRNNAVPVTRQNAPELVDLVAELAQRGNLPIPAVYVMQTEQPNAFATGRNPENAAVAVTQGLMQILNRDELAGVIAHELAHIRNRDTLTMTVAATLAGAIAMLGNMALWTGGRNGRGGLLAGLAAMIFAPVAATSCRWPSLARGYAPMLWAPRSRARPRGCPRRCKDRAGGGAGGQCPG